MSTAPLIAAIIVFSFARAHMTDDEFDFLVRLAQAPVEERETLLGSCVPAATTTPHSFIAKDILNLLLGRAAIGNTACAWLGLIEKEARSST